MMKRLMKEYKVYLMATLSFSYEDGVLKSNTISYPTTANQRIFFGLGDEACSKKLYQAKLYSSSPQGVYFNNPTPAGNVFNDTGNQPLTTNIKVSNVSIIDGPSSQKQVKFGTYKNVSAKSEKYKCPSQANLIYYYLSEWVQEGVPSLFAKNKVEGEVAIKQFNNEKTSFQFSFDRESNYGFFETTAQVESKPIILQPGQTVQQLLITKLNGVSLYIEFEVSLSGYIYGYFPDYPQWSANACQIGQIFGFIGAKTSRKVVNRVDLCNTVDPTVKLQLV